MPLIGGRPTLFAYQYSYARIRFQSLTQNYIEYTCEITARSVSV